MQMVTISLPLHPLLLFSLPRARAPVNAEETSSRARTFANSGSKYEIPNRQGETSVRDAAQLARSRRRSFGAQSRRADERENERAKIIEQVLLTGCGGGYRDRAISLPRA